MYSTDEFFKARLERLTRNLDHDFLQLEAIPLTNKCLFMFCGYRAALDGCGPFVEQKIFVSKVFKIKNHGHDRKL